MTREKLEQEISIITAELDVCNKKTEELRDKLRNRMIEYLSMRPVITELKPVFAYSGKTKDLLAALQSEIQKAQ